MQHVLAIIDAYGLLPLIIVSTMLLVERWMPWPEKYHPLTLFRLIAINLAQKVNPAKPRTDSQRRISGTLAIIVLTLPMLTIIAISLVIAQFPLFFDSFMLLIALQFQPIINHYRRVRSALQKDKKLLARQMLSNIVLRETQSLSPVGIGKAAIESVLLRFFYQQFAIILWYLAGGGLAALTVRLVFELRQCWNTKLNRNSQFGQPANMLSNALYVLPSWLYMLLFSLGYGFVGAFRAYKNRPNHLPSRYLVKLVCAGSLGVQLGGPAIYESVKTRYPKVGASREVRFDDLARAQSAIHQTLLFLLVTLLLTTTLFHQAHFFN
ncbi:cobalamin biosynthesis protein CobD/CbiB [Aliiglaciecola litoralis]|uniref:Cobalamin biosynthesis family protein n=1 Tax=Aliiglaciecola litoralis TaxID=582857 RepID=A0ABP3X1V9_9ALTE